jgi:hypothetical protein
MTKNEKELVAKVTELMARKGIEGNPSDFYTITKRSNKDYFAELKVGNRVFAAKGTNSKEVCKNLIKEMN